MSETISTALKKSRAGLLFDLLLLLILLAGAFLRFRGLFWGEYKYLHPDERFLVWVGVDISPVNSLAEYWDTANSSLNPHNRGHGFYVYGTLPMFLARYAVEWVYGHTGWTEMTNVGRALSATADLLTVLLVYLVGRRVYERRVGLIAAALSAFAVLQIQHAHFFTMDSFTTFFATLTVYFAVRVAYDPAPRGAGRRAENRYSPLLGITSTTTTESPRVPLSGFWPVIASNPILLLSIGFGVALGMAVASKVNAAPLALLLPAALLIRYSRSGSNELQERSLEILGCLVVAGVVSLLIFRIFQPYAFSGPGFFGLKPNEAWLANLNELRHQASGVVDFPPALQWARRPVWFAWQNMVLWGMGLPMGLAAWAGFLWAGWRTLKGEWRAHILLWAWTGLYFTWQSLVFNPSMRYQLLIYPTLAIFAARGILRLITWGRSPARPHFPAAGRLKWAFAIMLVVGILAGTGAYAFAFSNIYVKPITRIEASRWIYQNIPGPVNLVIQTEKGPFNQPIPFYYNYSVQPEIPYLTSFVPLKSGILRELRLGQVIDPATNTGEKDLTITVSDNPGQSGQLSRVSIEIDTYPGDSESPKAYTAAFETPIPLLQGEDYFIQIEVPSDQGPIALSGSLDFNIQGNPAGLQSLPLTRALVDTISPYSTSFVAAQSGSLEGVTLNLQVPTGRGTKTLKFAISDRPDGAGELAFAELRGEFDAGDSTMGEIIALNEPVAVVAGQTYYLSIGLSGSEGGLTLRGAAVANEGAWDDGLPVPIDNFDGFGGIYIPGLNFDMYEDDNPNKLSRFYNILDRTEYILISSNRQWGTLPRLPERFPMNLQYYRSLIGCPPERSIEWCYIVAQPGVFKGELGFELIKVFDSGPSLGEFELNDQYAEEAFTVYDHPKVFIFRKSPDYDPERVRKILGSVDLSKVVHVTPRRAGSLPRDMMLPESALKNQLSGGTWSELFNQESLLNRSQTLGVIAWYLVIAFLGICAYPLLRFTLPGLSDRAYPFARIAGLLVLSYLVWLAGSFGIPFNKITISAGFAGVAIVGALLAYHQRSGLRNDWQEKRKYFLLVEGLFLVFFSADLLIRLGNPDLWHPWMGGEKPMDFSYFNAVLKSTTFPPYDPWFVGGYINYYYFGFVFVGVVVKWMGITPSVAYNLIIPTIFAMIAMGAFSIGWNIVAARGRISAPVRSLVASKHFQVGIAAALGMAVLGNLGTLRLLLQGYQRLAAPEGIIEGTNIFTRLIWTAEGVLMTLTGASLPYSIRDWYWLPSRAIPAPNDVEPITEFPFFTVLYGDPHAHLFALPLTLLALAWALSVVFSRAWTPENGEGNRRSFLQICLSILVGGLAIGALWPTNTWDLPTFLGLGMLATGYAIWKHYEPGPGRADSWLTDERKRALLALAGAISLAAVSFILFRPYSKWYVQGYTDIAIWKGTHTPFWSYLTHWGAFLFLILCWMVWETREWMAATPLSAVRKLEPYKGLITGCGVFILLVILGLQLLGVAIAWFILPIAIWGMVLLFRPTLSIEKRVVLVLVTFGLLLTLMVEVIVLVGDIGRMNTVFKFYLQAWTLFSIGAAASLGWLLLDSPRWLPSWRTAWQVAVIILVFSTGLYPLLGGLAKVKDRISPEAPYTLDGMKYMQYAFYEDLGVKMDLSQDYRAILWFLENVSGSPAIIEGNMVEYHWGNRFTIYTGLPNVIGWNWHQRQQRARAPEYVIPERINDVAEFYLTPDIERAQQILGKYDVKYIVVGQLERALYPGGGLEKFELYDGSLWDEVFRDGDTVIYQVTGG